MSTSILKYFKLTRSSKLLYSAFASANSEVCSVMVTSSSREPYLHLMSAQKFKIRKTTSEHGATNTMRYCKKNFLNLPLKEMLVWRLRILINNRWGKWLEMILRMNWRSCQPRKWKSLQVNEYLKYLREQRSAINMVIAIATAEEVVGSVDVYLLACNGGEIFLTKGWARSLLNCMGMHGEEKPKLMYTTLLV